MSTKTGRERSGSGDQEYEVSFSGEVVEQPEGGYRQEQFDFQQQGPTIPSYNGSSARSPDAPQGEGTAAVMDQGGYGSSQNNGNHGSIGLPQTAPTQSSWSYVASNELDAASGPTTNGQIINEPAQAQSLWNLADASWTLPPVNIAPVNIGPAQDTSLALTTTSNANGNNLDMDTTDKAFQDVWRVLFGDNSGFTPSPSPPPVPPTAQLQVLQPDPAADLTLLSVFSPSQFGAAHNSHVEYLYHYLNVVLPLQYRLGSRALTDLIGPLAMTRDNVLTAAASLAAQHLAVQRTKKPLILSSSWKDGSDILTQSDDNDTMIATSAHRQSIERLRFLSSEDLTSEDVIVSALFAISFHLFSGGTSREWQEVMATSQRCLSAALNGSPEITGTP